MVASPFHTTVPNGALSDMSYNIVKNPSALNVKDYGAVGNDTADDTNAIQRAINDCHAAGGGVVYVPPGTYRITSTILLSSFVTLQGDGTTVSIIRQRKDHAAVIRVDGYSRWSVCGLELQSPGSTGGDTGGNGFELRNSVPGNSPDFWRIDNVTVTNWGSGHAITGQSGSLAHVSGSTTSRSVTVTGLSNMSTASVGNYLKFPTLGSGSLTGSNFGINKGLRRITSFINTGSVVICSPTFVEETNLAWEEHRPGIAFDFDNEIADVYFASVSNIRASSAGGGGNNKPAFEDQIGIRVIGSILYTSFNSVLCDYVGIGLYLQSGAGNLTFSNCSFNACERQNFRGKAIWFEGASGCTVYGMFEEPAIDIISHFGLLSDSCRVYATGFLASSEIPNEIGITSPATAGLSWNIRESISNRQQLIGLGGSGDAYSGSLAPYDNYPMPLRFEASVTLSTSSYIGPALNVGIAGQYPSTGLIRFARTSTSGAITFRNTNNLADDVLIAYDVNDRIQIGSLANLDTQIYASNSVALLANTAIGPFIPGFNYASTGMIRLPRISTSGAITFRHSTDLADDNLLSYDSNNRIMLGSVATDITSIVASSTINHTAPGSQFGATGPFATTGIIRLPKTTTSGAITFRNFNNNADINIISYDLNDNIAIGNSSTDIDVVSITSSDRIILSAGNGTLVGPASGVYPTTGLIRLASISPSGSITFRNGANTADNRLVSWDTADQINIGSTASSNITLSTSVGSGTFINTSLTLFNNIGQYPSTGLIRLAKTTTSGAITFRNGANTADDNLISYDSNDQIFIGSSTGGSANLVSSNTVSVNPNLTVVGVNNSTTGIIRLPKTITSASITFRKGSNDANLDLVAYDLNDRIILGNTVTDITSIQASSTISHAAPGSQFGTTGPFPTTGLIRLPKTTTSGAITFRSAGNTADNNLVAYDVNDRMQLGSAANLDTQIYANNTVQLFANTTIGPQGQPFASTGIIRFPKTTTSQSITFRNTNNNADDNLLAYDSNDRITLGSAATDITIIAASSVVNNNAPGIQIGTAGPFPSTGLIRLPKTTTSGAITFRSAGNTADDNLIAYDVNDRIQLGSAANLDTQIYASNSVQLFAGITTIGPAGSTFPASGLIRLPLGTNSFIFRGSASSDYRMIGYDSSNQIFVGDTNSSNITLATSGAASVFINTSLTMYNGGGQFPSTGLIRLAMISPSGSITFKNQANTADNRLISWDTSDQITIGSTASSNITLTTSTSTSVFINTSLTMFNSVGQYPTSGLIRLAKTSSSGSITFRNQANNADDNLIAYDTSDRTIIGSTAAATIISGTLFTGQRVLAANKINNALTPFTISGQQNVIFADSTSGVITVNLPASPTFGETYIIVDSAGTSNTNNITIAGNGHNINGASSLIMSNSYASNRVCYNGTIWNILSTHT